MLMRLGYFISYFHIAHSLLREIDAEEGKMKTAFNCVVLLQRF
jgi:hypothetical protein